MTQKEETSIRFYTTQHPLYCGIDLHARTMYVCILDQNGELLVALARSARDGLGELHACLDRATERACTLHASEPLELGVG